MCIWSCIWNRGNENTIYGYDAATQAYPTSYTTEKVFIVAGPEFGEREGHILVIRKAIYGLRVSGKNYCDLWADCMRKMGFTPCLAAPDIWLRPNEKLDCYEYVATYVDDLCICMEDPAAFIQEVKDRFDLEFKGVGAIKYHLGMDIGRDTNGVMFIQTRKYVEKMSDNYERMFGSKPKHVYTSPLDPNDHPETDTSDFLDSVGIEQYQSLIGSMQWAVTIGRFDIAPALTTMSSFRVDPRFGHLERCKRMVGYLTQFRAARIRIRPDEPDLSDVPLDQYDWMNFIYGDVREVVPSNAPKPRGCYVLTTHYVDANLMHDVMTGRSMVGILHLVNQMPLDWSARKTPSVESATYGSELTAARICVDQIVEIRNLLHYLGVPIRDRSYMFGDNEAVVNSAISPFAKLHKRHNLLSFHRVREATALGMIVFRHVAGKINPSDTLSKHRKHKDVWKTLRPLLFWQGDTYDLVDIDLKAENK